MLVEVLEMTMQVHFRCDFVTSTALPVASYSFPLNLRVPVCVPVTLVVNLQHGSTCVIATKLMQCALYSLDAAADEVYTQPLPHSVLLVFVDSPVIWVRVEICRLEPAERSGCELGRP